MNGRPTRLLKEAEFDKAWLVQGSGLEYQYNGDTYIGDQRVIGERHLLPINDPDAGLETEETKEFQHEN